VSAIQKELKTQESVAESVRKACLGQEKEIERLDNEINSLDKKAWREYEFKLGSSDLWYANRCFNGDIVAYRLDEWKSFYDNFKNAADYARRDDGLVLFKTIMDEQKKYKSTFRYWHDFLNRGNRLIREYKQIVDRVKEWEKLRHEYLSRLASVIRAIYIFRRETPALEALLQKLPSVPDVTGLKEFLAHSWEHSWELIRKRQRGVPGGAWYSPIHNLALKKAGFHYFSVAEKGRAFRCRVWTAYGKRPLNIAIVRHSQPENFWLQILYNQILSAIVDMAAVQHFIAKPRPMLPEYRPENSPDKPPGKPRKKCPARVRYYPRKSPPPYGTRNARSEAERRMARTAFVTWFCRRLPKGKAMSAIARQNALFYGAFVPSGCTFVRPFTRGTGNSAPKKVITALWSASYAATIEKLLGF